MYSEHPDNPIRQIPDGSWISADGGWLWRGGRWVPLPAVAWPPGLFWFTVGPSWFPTVLVVGLIALIPIAGAMNLYGYALVTSRNLRAGYRVLPPANLSYISAGAPVAVLAILWGLIVLLLFFAVGIGVGVLAYSRSHDWAWTIALGYASAISVAVVLSTFFRVLSVPALDLSGRVGWRVLHGGGLIRHARERWRATWYGTGVLLIWSAGYFGLSFIAAFVPLGGIAVAILGSGVMAAMLAVVLARFDDPPAGFTEGWANALAAAVGGLSLLGIGLVWVVALSVASYISGHPEEVTCSFTPGCSASYSGDLETITHVQRDSQNPALVMLQVEFINHSRAPVLVNTGDYELKPIGGGSLPPSSDCALPSAATVPAGGRLEQRLCFLLPDTQTGFEVHLPWTGWIYPTGPVPCTSPSVSSKPPC